VHQGQAESFHISPQEFAAKKSMWLAIREPDLLVTEGLVKSLVAKDRFRHHTISQVVTASQVEISVNRTASSLTERLPDRGA
jgi:hypothetical protein